MYVKLLSMPMNFLPSFLQTAPVVPVPKKGSKTKSPGLVDAKTILSNNSSGF